MTADTLTGKLVVMQPTFGVMHTRLALDGGIDSPKEAINDLGWDQEELLKAVFKHEDAALAFDSITTADVPPPRDEADHEHVLVIGDVEISEDDFNVETYTEDERDTTFLGKEMEMVDTPEK